MKNRRPTNFEKSFDMKLRDRSIPDYQGVMWNRFRKFFILIIWTVIINFSPNSAFPQDDDINEYVPISFDLKTGTFDRIFPFDQPFSISVKNITQEVNNLHLEIHEYNSDYSKIKNLSYGSTINPEKLKDMRIVYKSYAWKRSDLSENSANLIFPYRLKPNLIYIIVVVAENRAALSSEQEANLKKDLKKDMSIEGFIVKLGLQHFEPDGHQPRLNMLYEEQRKFNEIAATAVKKVNPDFRVESMDLPTQLGEFTGYVMWFNALKNNIESLNGAVQADLPEGDKKKFNNAVQKFWEDVEALKSERIMSSESSFEKLLNIVQKRIIDFEYGNKPLIQVIKKNITDSLGELE